MSDQRSWRWWLPLESIQNEVPSVTAILETIIAVPLYWWIALHTGVILPLLISAAVAPLVLLRSDASIALGRRWFTAWEHGRSAPLVFRSLKFSHAIASSASSRIVIGFVVAYFLANTLLSSLSDWHAFFGGIVVAWTAVAITTSFVSAIAALDRSILFQWQQLAAAGFQGPQAIGTVLGIAGGLTDLGAANVAGAAVGAAMAPTAGIILRARGAGQIAAMAGVAIILIFTTVIAISLWGLIGVGAALSSGPTIYGSATGVLLVGIAIRFLATARYLRDGFKALPRNFRRLILCTSPRHSPELVPGLVEEESRFTFQKLLREYNSHTDLRGRSISLALLIAWFVPGWLYRVTIKSTSWFWWPLAFLGGDLKRVQNPALFHWQVMGSLWAKTSIVLASVSLLSFAVANAVRFLTSGAIFDQNPLLHPIGYLLLLDWNFQYWQVCTLSASALSIATVYSVNYVGGIYRIAQETRDAKILKRATSQYGWIERMTRFRFLLLLGLWGLVGTHAFLYANVVQGWYVSFPLELVTWMVAIYGDRFPGYNQYLLLP